MMPDPRDFMVYNLLSRVLAEIVDYPDGIVIRTVWGDKGGTFSVQAKITDLRHLIGRQGRNIESIRNVMRGIGVRNDRRYSILMDEAGSGGSRSLVKDS